MPPRKPTQKQLNIRARNRANAKKSTGLNRPELPGG